MASYDLNEVLKKRAAQKEGMAAQTDGSLALDDVSRVKVLSPGRQVFKRFIRNRLAVCGSVILIIMFVFSFLGPFFYPYGQKQIFYKHDKQNVNYALAKENTAYNGYEIDASLPVERNIINAMNSNIKKMIEAGQDELTLPGEGVSYLIRKEIPSVYTLSTMESSLVCSAGNSVVKVGTYSMVGKKLEFSVDEIPGLADAAAKEVKGVSGSFTADGVEYQFTRGEKPKTYDISCEMNGIVYTGEKPGDGFEKALDTALSSGSSFAFEGKQYILDIKGSRTDVYEAGEPAAARVFTKYTLDTYESGVSLPDDFRALALMAAVSGDSFTCDGITYKTVPENEAIIILDEDGNEFAEFNSFSVRRYSGEDTMSYALKKAISAKVEEMLLADVKTDVMTAEIPLQEEDGSYMTDENGEFVLSETEMKITQRLAGEYVINCDQINFIIDIFASPSGTHVLGTDGDGFDVLARIMYGGRISLMVGFIVVLIETVLGVIMGGIAGYFGGWVDNLIMRLVDIFYCLPSLPIMIILGAMMDAIRLDTYIRLMVMMAALGLMGWAGVARMVRGQILSLREQEFMVATEATGIRIKARIFRHLVPNVMPQLIVIATMSLGGVIITESTLSYLGLGVKHPLATWGTIINSVSSASAMAHYAFIWIPVGLLICLTVIAFNFVGDGLRDAYDPKAKR
ncbi:MAG: ABC transporter permease [Blautia sp.]|nr:ABC transporter permease [Blautia sp.]